MTQGERRRQKGSQQHRLRRMHEEGVSSKAFRDQATRANASIDCGWGRLIAAYTFESPSDLVDLLRREAPDRRDIAFYVKDPHVVLAEAPQELFLDPSHSFRLNLATYRSSSRSRRTFQVRRLTTLADAEAINVIYAACGMVSVPPDFFWSQRDDRSITVLVAEDSDSGEILGSVMGVDHARAFDEPEKGSSLWCLAVSPKCPHPGVGEALVRRLAEYFKARGASHLDLSVLHDNKSAIDLYEKLGFRRIPFFAIKRKNPINERLFSGAPPEADLNPYARIIVDEARRRGIGVEVTDSEYGMVRLTYGGRSVHCRESLSELTSSVAMSICDDKRLTHRVVSRAGLVVPQQLIDDDAEKRAQFLRRHGSVVVKPARGEQGRGVAVDIRNVEDMETAVSKARAHCENVIVEACFDGSDLRLVVIDYKVVATAVRRPARVVGDGRTSIQELIRRQSRRRAAATKGESQIPMDAETERCVAAAGYGFEDILPSGTEIQVRKSANLHTGGTIDDVTMETHSALIDAAIKAARAIEIPVVGIDLMVKSPRQPEYVFIEANERPGLANHEPQPTAERFVDLLFPLSMPQAVRIANKRQTQ